MRDGFAALLLRWRRIAPERWVLGGLAVAALVLWWWAAAMLPRALEVTAFAVGDGDAYLIRTPSGRCLMIDAGSRTLTDVGKQVLVPNLLLLGVHRLDGIIMTHPDSDHVNGFPDIIDSIPVGRMLSPEMPQDEGVAFQQVVEQCTARGVPRYPLRAGQVIHLDPDVSLRVLAPGPQLIAGTASDTNNNCAVCLLQYGRTRMLFTGDLELEGEEALRARCSDLRADVLTAAHHGSRNGASDALLDAVRPRIAIVSAGGDQLGQHPHPATLDRLRARGITVLRTDVHGRIRLASDGRQWRFSTYREAARVGNQ